MIYNLKITIVLNSKLSRYSSLVPIKIAESLQFKTILVFTNWTFCLQINKENFFLYFYSKRKFLSSNEPKVTSNEQKLASNDQNITSNEQKTLPLFLTSKTFQSFIFLKPFFLKKKKKLQKILKMMSFKLMSV